MHGNAERDGLDLGHSGRKALRESLLLRTMTGRAPLSQPAADSARGAEG